MLRVPAEKFPDVGCNDEDVIRAWHWFRGFISDKAWQRRKAQIESEISIEFKNSPSSRSLTEGTLLTIHKDQIGWYLYLVDTYINEPYKYEYFQGARVMPIFKRLGADLSTVLQIHGIERKVKTLIHQRREEADSTLFEVLTALLWIKSGWEVSFLEPSRTTKMPDLFARRGAEHWQIECKRLKKTADYTYKETAKRQKMVSYISGLLLEYCVLLDITFHVEIETLPDTYLKDLLQAKIPLVAVQGKIVSNEEVDVDLTYINIKIIQEHLRENSVKQNSPQMIALIAQKPIDPSSFTAGIMADFFRVGEGYANNLYVSHLEKAFGVIWQCDAERTIHAKARDIKRQIQEAASQFNPASKGVIHIGIETYEGAKVELERTLKIEKTLSEINPLTSNVRWMYCHFFQSYARPDIPWIFDETATTITAYVNTPSPINNSFLIVPESAQIIKDVAHWDRPLPEN